MTVFPPPLCWEDMYPRAKQRFPHLQPETVPSLEQDRDGFVAYLANTHHLTLREAREEVEDFLFTESLHAELDVEPV
ncbi:hypothetical protein [Pseudophaeobacter sp.]|uniref:hypothetical protein n=1 Tax=Pseudophaeobacter sp. TaxID=1971739 RepID=UPI00329955E3